MADACRRGDATRVQIGLRERVGNYRKMTANRRIHPLLTAAGLLVVMLVGVLTAGSALGSGAHSSKATVAGSVTIQNRTFRLSGPDQKQRLTVGCPGRTLPLGGGMPSPPAPARAARASTRTP